MTDNRRVEIRKEEDLYCSLKARVDGIPLFIREDRQCAKEVSYQSVPGEDSGSRTGVPG